jgi:hypothetical protein
LAGFHRDFRFTGQKQICRLQRENRADVTTEKLQPKGKPSMKHTPILVLIALLGVAAVGLPSLRGATFTVINTNDNGVGSLRQALADAVDGDAINFNSSLNRQTITLTSGELMVNKSVTISGPGANTLAVDANHASRVFHIASGKDVTISGLTATHGSAPLPYYYGGGIYNDHATLTLRNCIITGNSIPTDSYGSGGGIYNDGYYQARATLTVSNCTISGNSVVLGTGGGITNSGGTLTVANSTVSGNSAQEGGGIHNFDPYFSGALTVTNCTFSGNSAVPPYGGSVYNYGTLKIGDTILNAGPLGGNIYNDQRGTVTSLGYNLSSDDGGGFLTATGDQINTDPMLGPLQDNGGPTFSHLPAPNSPAIDGGDPALGMDQRGPGFVRVKNGRIDIGAIEAQATPTPTPKPHGYQ